MKKTGPVLLALAIVAALACLTLRSRPESALQQETRFLMDTCVTIKTAGGSQARRAITKALDRMAEINVKFNALDSRSPIYRFNHENLPIEDPEIIALVETANVVSRQTDGAFDITVYPLVKLWGFYKDCIPAVPSTADISNCLGRIGWQNLAVRDGKLTKLRDDVGIDLGGIAKGYAVAEALKVLKKEGITSALIDAGGDIYALGLTSGRKWKIGIRHPSGQGVMEAVNLADATIVTSGDYERFFETNGVRYHHILDPKTGYPARGARSVTIIASDAALADGYSTALFVMGPERAMTFAGTNGTFDALIVTADDKTLMTPGFAGALRTKQDR